ncbi:MAG: hypothetical protein M3O31_01660 [Acidobacteriota bacterium]|nr:hypothetical protein [Acidobacteriota bacterium]
MGDAFVCGDVVFRQHGAYDSLRAMLPRDDNNGGIGHERDHNYGDDGPGGSFFCFLL